jgi:hypothetical protein
MSLYHVPDSFYRMLPEGTPGWQFAPVPGWGANPLRAGPPRVGVGADEPVTIDTGRPHWHMGGRILAQDDVLPKYAALAGSIPWQDAVLPKYAAISDPGLAGCGACAGCCGVGEVDYKQTTWGHVALAAAGGIVLGMVFMYAWKG